MMKPSIEAKSFDALVVIRPDHSLERTASIISEALGVTFRPELSGEYEEYPAFVACVMGLKLALLAPPLPEHDIREVPDDNFHLMVSSYSVSSGEGECVSLGQYLQALLARKAQLRFI